ncbi:MAG: DegV family EDD domain-containing protein [Thermoleophilia bacterium]|nr:DegV family EDD domain-containing protein [Thermoleophilia bacterium]
MRPIHTRVGQVVRGAATALEASRQRIDDLNVYPVPDGDTGTNMSQTVSRVVHDLRDAPQDTDPGALAQRIARSALVGARGNSGVILSQIIRGAVTSLADSSKLDAAALARALRAASDAAYGSVRQPVEGTILTVVREMAEEAEAARGDALDPALDRVLARAEDALSRTPTMLQKLADAGVVDAGGAGLVEIVRGAVAGLRGQAPPAAEGTSLTPPVVHGEEEESGYRYCTGFLVLDTGGALDADALHASLMPLGDSLLVVGDPTALRVHVHTDDPGAALTLGTRHGGISGVEISDMRQQTVERVERLSHGGVEAVPHRRCDVVAVVDGAGNEDLVRARGARGIVKGGQTLNPSTEEILEAIDACNADEVVVLPNNANILLAARNAASLSPRPVLVVESTSIPAGVVALDAYSSLHSAEDNAAAMRAAIAGIATAEITQAVREAKVEGVNVARGAWMGLVDGHLVATSSRLNEVASRVAAVMITPDRRSLLVLRGGSEVPGGMIDAALASVASAYPALEVEDHVGGQGHYPLLMAARPVGRRLHGATTAIVLDSTADLVPDPVTHPGWRMVPLTVRFGDEEFLDQVQLSGPEFYRRLRHAKVMPRTAAPPPGAFARVYEDLLEQYRDVVSLHISGKLSSTVESARAAADGLGPRVVVHDTLAAAGLIALTAEGVQRLLDRGTTAQEVEEYIRAVPARGGIAFSVDTLEYLQKNGRIGRATAVIGGLLRVRPILALIDGEVDAVRKVRGRRAAIPALVETMVRRSAGHASIDVAVLHADSESDARSLAAAVRRSRAGIAGIRTMEIGAVIGAHTGPGALGVAFLAR